MAQTREQIEHAERVLNNKHEQNRGSSGNIETRGGSNTDREISGKKSTSSLSDYFNNSGRQNLIDDRYYNDPIRIIEKRQTKTIQEDVQSFISKYKKQHGSEQAYSFRSSVLAPYVVSISKAAFGGVNVRYTGSTVEKQAGDDALAFTYQYAQAANRSSSTEDAYGNLIRRYESMHGNLFSDGE